MGVNKLLFYGYVVVLKWTYNCLDF